MECPYCTNSGVHQFQDGSEMLCFCLAGQVAKSKDPEMWANPEDQLTSLEHLQQIAREIEQ